MVKTRLGKMDVFLFSTYLEHKKHKDVKKVKQIQAQYLKKINIKKLTYLTKNHLTFHLHLFEVLINYHIKIIVT